MNQTMNVREAADYVWVSERWIYECLRKGKLKGSKLNGHWRIEKTELDDYADLTNRRTFPESPPGIKGFMGMSESEDGHYTLYFNVNGRPHLVHHNGYPTGEELKQVCERLHKGAVEADGYTCPECSLHFIPPHEGFLDVLHDGGITSLAVDHHACPWCWAKVKVRPETAGKEVE